MYLGQQRKYLLRAPLCQKHAYVGLTAFRFAAVPVPDFGHTGLMLG